MGSSRDHPRDIEELRKEYERLNREKITAEANLQTSTQTLENLKKQARERYGTDDLAALRAKLKEMTEENERKRAEYQKHVTAIENELAEVEAQHAKAASREG